MSDPHPLLVAIGENPDDRPRWLALAAWYTEHGRHDEADAVRVLWPTFRNCSKTMPLAEVLSQVRQAAKVLGDIARTIEARTCEMSDERPA